MTVDEANRLLIKQEGIESFLVQDMAQVYERRIKRGDGGEWHHTTIAERHCRVVISTGKKLADLNRPTIAEAVEAALIEVGLKKDAR